MKKFVFAFVALFAFSGAFAQVEPTAASETMAEIVKEAANESWMQISAEDSAGYIFETEPFLLDVRTEGEYDDGHLEGAVLAPIQTIDEHLGAMPADLDTPILIYCAAGTRGFWGLAYVTSLGYTNVKNMRGGYRAWVELGYPTTLE
jgi:rhodanese-related sulfurtransferase